MELYVAKEISQAVHFDGSVVNYTMGPLSYMYLLVNMSYVL